MPYESDNLLNIIVILSFCVLFRKESGIQNVFYDCRDNLSSTLVRL